MYLFTLAVTAGHTALCHRAVGAFPGSEVLLAGEGVVTGQPGGSRWLSVAVGGRVREVAMSDVKYNGANQTLRGLAVF